MNTDKVSVSEALYIIKNTLDLMMRDSEKQAERETEINYIGFWRGRMSAFEYARDLVDDAIDALDALDG